VLGCNVDCGEWIGEASTRETGREKMFPIYLRKIEVAS